MKSSLKALAERLGPVQDVPRNQSGSRESVVIDRASGDAAINVPAAALELAKTGISLLKSKRSLERLLEGHNVPLLLPKVSDRIGLERALMDAGVRLRVISAPRRFSVKKLRERLQLTQEEFSVLYGVDLRTLQGYESGTRKPDRTTLGYFTLIEADPERIRDMRLELAH